MNHNLRKAGLVIVLILLAAGVYAVTHKSDDTMAGMTEHSMQANVSSTNDKVQDINMVTYKGFDVVEKHIRIKKGTTVTWTNADSAKHDVTPDTETADFQASELFGKGQTYSHTFNTVGTFAYHCSPHPYMKGIVEVVE